MPRTSSNLDILERESASQHHAIRDDFVAVGQFHRFQPNGEHGKVFARKIGGKPPKSLKYHLQYSLVYFWFTVFPTPFFGCPKKFQPNRPRKETLPPDHGAPFGALEKVWLNQSHQRSQGWEWQPFFSNTQQVLYLLGSPTSTML